MTEREEGGVGELSDASGAESTPLTLLTVTVLTLT